MDLVDYDQGIFDDIVSDYRDFANEIGIEDFLAIPISGLRGDNITEKSETTPWYDGQALLGHLETVGVDTDRLVEQPFRLPVQWVNRPDLDFRGFAGTVASGRVKPGDSVRVLPSGKVSTVARIVTFNGDLDEAQAGQSVTITLADEIDCSRGDVIAAADAPPEVADQFEATVVWMAEEPMLPGRPYAMKIGTNAVRATITDEKYQVNVNTMEKAPGKTLELNGIAVCNISLDKPVPFVPYDENADLGGFILIDRITNATVGAGMIHFALRRSQNIHWQAVDITRDAHAEQKGQKAKLLWFTGLSGSGKSTIANLVEKKLHALGKHSFLLDGDNVRHGLNRDLGFTDADRVENIRRVGEVAKLMTDAGLIVLTAFISPFRSERQMVRQMIPEGDFIEVFVDTPLSVAEERDVKGLYKKARAGELKNFTGIDSPYEEPEHAEIRVNTVEMTAEEAADYIVERLLEE
jgi:bifunctional enzyme CysN/CysC